MGEYANLQIREDMKRMTGFDPGPIDDNETPKQRKAKPVYKRVKCPHCDAHPKECGLWQHIQDAHGISKVDQAIAKAAHGITGDEMTTEANEGGPAFPNSFSKDYPTEIVGGMTLRDHFAGLAMQGEIAGLNINLHDYAYAELLPKAEAAYRMADAMLEARKVKP